MNDPANHEKVLGPRYLPRIGRRRIGFYLRWRVEFLVGVLSWRDAEERMSFVSIGLGPIEVQASIDTVFSRTDEHRLGVTEHDATVLADEVGAFLAEQPEP